MNGTYNVSGGRGGEPGGNGQILAYNYGSAAPVAISTITAASSATNQTGGGGIPEFPYQTVNAMAFTALIVTSYLIMRRHLKIKNAVPSAEAV